MTLSRHCAGPMLDLLTPKELLSWLEDVFLVGDMGYNSGTGGLAGPGYSSELTFGHNTTGERFPAPWNHQPSESADQRALWATRS